MKYKRINIVEPESEKPEEDVITVESSRLIRIEEDSCHFELRNDGELKNKALYLNNYIEGNRVEWITVKDSVGLLCAVPLIKKE